METETSKSIECNFFWVQSFIFTLLDKLYFNKLDRYSKFCRIFTFLDVSISDSQKIDYFRRIRHPSIESFEESEQHSRYLPLSSHWSSVLEDIVCSATHLASNYSVIWKLNLYHVWKYTILAILRQQTNSLFCPWNHYHISADKQFCFIGNHVLPYNLNLLLYLLYIGSFYVLSKKKKIMN